LDDVCPSVLGGFLLPQIGSLRAVDPTLRSFCIETKDSNCYFPRILNLCSGLTLSVDFHDLGFVAFVKDICREMKNRELCENMFRLSDEDLTLSHVFDRIHVREGLRAILRMKLRFAHHIFLTWIYRQTLSPMNQFE
jgi:hypothetical protein